MLKGEDVKNFCYVLEHSGISVEKDNWGPVLTALHRLPLTCPCSRNHDAEQASIKTSCLDDTLS